MKYYDVQQKSQEWFDLRLGKFTASTIKNLFAKKNTQTYQDEINRVVYERFTGNRTEVYVNEAMAYGILMEDVAREKYEMEQMVRVKQAGICIDDSGWMAASPDGFVEDGLLEIKCPQPATMITYLLNQTIPDKYIYQINLQLYLAEKEWCDFVAYNHNFPLLIIRYNRDEKIIKAILDEVDIAKEQVIKTLTKIKEQIT